MAVALTTHLANRRFGWERRASYDTNVIDAGIGAKVVKAGVSGAGLGVSKGFDQADI
jgi:hypothetical protein